MRMQCKCRLKKIKISSLNYLILTCDIDTVYHAIIIRPLPHVRGFNISQDPVKTTVYFRFGSFSCHAHLMVILMVVVQCM